MHIYHSQHPLNVRNKTKESAQKTQRLYATAIGWGDQYALYFKYIHTLFALILYLDAFTYAQTQKCMLRKTKKKIFLFNWKISRGIGVITLFKVGVHSINWLSTLHHTLKLNLIPTKALRIQLFLPLAYFRAHIIYHTSTLYANV